MTPLVSRRSLAQSDAQDRGGRDYDAGRPSHLVTDAALRHATARSGGGVEWQWLPTDLLTGRDVRERLQSFSGFFLGPGSPYKSLPGALSAIRFARESGRPLLGTCGGGQHVAIEYARHVLGLADAQHAEYDPYASLLFISALPCSLAGRTLRIDIAPGSLAARAYGCLRAEERYHCDLGLRPEHGAMLERGGLATTGVEAGDEPSRGESRILELGSHAFFMATLFVPQMRSTLESPHPLIGAFVGAVANPSG